MKPEEKARQQIDQLLEQVGWKVQDYRELNLGTSLGIAVREFPLKSGSADYLLFVDRKPVGVVEAKPQGSTLSGVAEQIIKYITKIEESLPQITTIPPFAYETTGAETFFRDLRDPDPRSRRVFAFHQPKTLPEWLSEEDTLPPLLEQHKIVEEIESRFSIADNLEKIVEQSLKQSDRLRQSILKRAFEGKLVSQDPTDEPAEKLLERIKKEEKLKQPKKEKIERDRRRRHEQKTG